MCFYTAVKKEKKKTSHSPRADGRDDRGNGRLDAVTTLLQTLPVKENVQSEDADNTVTTGFTEKYTGRVRSVLIIIIIINPLTARVVGAPQIILQPVFSIFPVLHCPLGLAEFQACPFPDVVFPPLPLSALSSSPFHCALQDGFGQT